MAKTIMIAPAGCSGATIDGHEIEPDAAGEVHISSPLMIETLKKHGFIVKGMAPAPNRIPVAVPDPNATFQPIVPAIGPIDADEMSKADLKMALLQRGIDYQNDATRSELVTLANRWNAKHTGVDASGLIDTEELGAGELRTALKARDVAFSADDSRASLAAKAEAWNKSQTDAGTAKGTPRKPKAVASDFTGDETMDDLRAMQYPRLKSWMAFKGIAFVGTPGKEALLALAEPHFAPEEVEAV